jgi:hypothetical protein
MRGLRTCVLAVFLLAAAGVGGASASPRPPLFQNGRYAALGASGSLSFVVERSQVTRLQVRMPLICRNKRTHARSVPTLTFGASSGSRRPNTYSRIYLPADGSANVSFVVDDNSRQPEIYLSLQLHGAVGHVSLHARSDAAREICSGALGFDVRTAPR